MPMLNFTLHNPTYFAFGQDTQKETGSLVRKFGGTKALIHYGGGSVVRSGLLEQIRESLNKASIPFVELGGVVPNPRSGLVYQGIELSRREGVDFVLGVGGGSAIDSSKAISTGVPYAGDFWELFERKAVPAKALPMGCVLTFSATGTEASNSCVITHERNMLKRGLRTDFNRPLFAVMNPELTYTVPPFQTACGIADMMAHIFERYLTNTTDVDVTDRLCEAVLQTILRAAPIVMAKPDDYAARAELMWAGTLAHNGQLGVGREEDWGSHNISHEFSAAYDVPHGASLAVIMPHWMRYTLPGHEMRYAQMATRIFGCSMDFERPERTALEGIRRLQAFWKELGLPLTLGEVGTDPDDIPILTQKARCDEQGLLGNFIRMTKEDIAAILRLCREV